MIDIMRKSALQGQPKQSGKGKRAPKQLKYPSSVQPFMKLMGLNPQEMRSALQQAMTGGVGGGLMTTGEATEAFLKYRNKRYDVSLFTLS